MLPPLSKINFASKASKPPLRARVGILAGALTAFFLLLLAGLSLLAMMLALNGVSEGKAAVAMGLCLGFQLLLLLPGGAWLGAWGCRLLSERHRWNQAAAVAVSVLGVSSVALVLSFLAIVGSILISGIR
ncbi:MAG: hypothetical protein U1F66_11740 [bacterium]